MSSSVHHGYGSFGIDEQVGEKHGNRSHSFNSAHVFETYVRSGRWANGTQFGIRCAFRRHSNLRPYVANLRHRGARLDYSEAFTRSWEDAVDETGSLGSGPDGLAGSTLTSRSDGTGNALRTFGRNYQLGNYPMSIGSYVMSWDGNYNSGLSNAANNVTGAWGRESISEVDLQQNTIGNVFKHPFVGAGGAWFNVVGNVALSQGQVVISGVYNPPETRLMHAGYQIYYAKNGGTGTIVGPIKTTGETFPATTSATRFRDTTFAGFVVGDVGKYIAIHNQGIYLITAFVDASNVDVDSVTINEPFVNAASLTWTLRTGPIGEYFFRRRPYFKFNDWVNNLNGAYNVLAFLQMDEILYDKTEWNQIPQRTVYDGYSHWWWTTPNRSTAFKGTHGLMRHLHFSPQPFQAPVADGSLVLSDWAASFNNGYWEDICVDRNKKLWISAKSGDETKNVLMRVHPAPGGMAASPVVEAQWRMQQNRADAGGLSSSHIIALCDDRSAVYSGANSHRIWALSGNRNLTGVVADTSRSHGISYSDDDGTTWKRIHGLPRLETGTVTATNASNAVTGSGTAFLTQYTVGDWIRFGTDDRAHQIATIPSDTSLTLSIVYGGTTGGGKTHAKVTAGDAALTNGSGAVVVTGGLLLSTLAIGDWVRFGTDARSYLITARPDDTNMTISPVYQGTTRSTVAIRRGGLEQNECRSRTGYTFSNSSTDYNDGQHTIDWDTLGNVYWLSDDTGSGVRICRWKESDGVCVNFAQTAIPAVGPLAAINGTQNAIGFLRVVRVPEVAGSGVHPFHNEVWLGCTYINSGDNTQGGWIRVRGDVAWTATPTAANFTRYHYNNSITTSFPSIVRVPKDGASDFQPRNTSIFMEPTTGNIGLFASYGEGTAGWHWLHMTGTELNGEFWRPTQNMAYSVALAGGTREPLRRAAWDEEGMGMSCVVSAQDSNTFLPTSEPPLALNGSVWVDRRWNGVTWVPAMVAGSVHYDLNLRGGSNVRTRAAVLGGGFRRVHEWVKPLEDGMYISFLQAGGAVAQGDEFMADEASTFVCSIGALKDNTQTCNVYYQFYVQPTIYRAADETIKLVKNINTVSGGTDGGYTSSVNGSLTFTPPFSRGVALGHKFPAGYGTSAGFLSTNAQATNSSTANQATICLRIDDQLELDNDAFWTGGTDLFNTTSGHVFVAGDVGKSIFIEGANGNTLDADNGQAVILARISATQVQVDKTFATTRTAGVGRRWKLRDIPAVAFMEAGFFNTPITGMKLYSRHDLWSSKDHGQNWVLVKYSGEGTSSSPAGGPDDVSPGVWYTCHNGYRGQAIPGDGNTLTGCSIIFDLRGLPENQRRRQYWRWRMFDPNNAEQPTTWFADVFLYDANFVMLNRPASNKLDDADDDLFFGCTVDKIQNIRATGVNATPVNDGNADGLTNTVNVPGPLYTDSGVNDAQVTSAGRFIDATAAFTRLSVGNFIKISGAVNAANNGWALITSFVSATEVQTSKSFVNETNTFTWATCSFGPNDELRIESPVVLNNRGVALDDTYYVITDVPSTTQITVQAADMPHPITAAPWEVGRNFSHSSSHPSAFTLFDSNNNMAWGHVEGSLVFGYDLEFVVVQSGGTGATTPADTDADGRTDEIILATALVAADGPVAGDMIEVVHATYGTRMFEIASITGADPNKVVKVKFDELPVSLTTISWRILRRRNLQARVQRVTVVGRGAPVT